MALKVLSSLSAVPDRPLVLKIPKSAGKAEIFMRYLTKDSDHIGSKNTTNDEVWFPSDFPIVKTTDGSTGVMVIPEQLGEVSQDRILEFAYEPEEKPEAKKPGKDG